MISRPNLYRTLIFVLFVGPGPVIGLIPFWITRWHMRTPVAWWRYAGLLMIVVGAIPLFDSIARFVHEGRGTPEPLHPTQTLVITGLYRYVRNPMYVGEVTMILGQAVFFAAVKVAIYGVCAAVVMHLFVLFYEEPTLQRKYGPEYDAYRKRVSRWIPRFSR